MVTVMAVSPREVRGHSDGCVASGGQWSHGQIISIGENKIYAATLKIVGVHTFALHFDTIVSISRTFSLYNNIYHLDP